VADLNQVAVEGARSTAAPSEPAQVGSGGDVLSAAFSGDRALLAAADVDGLIRMWDTRAGDAHEACARLPLT
jgi:WD40 repeat protein